MSPASGSPSAILVAHSSESFHEELRALATRWETHGVHDVLAAASQVSDTRFSFIVLQHPLAGMAATDVARWLRECGATCPFLVVPEGASVSQRAELARSFGDEGIVAASDTPQAVLEALEAAIAPAAPASSPPRPSSSPPRRRRTSVDDELAALTSSVGRKRPAPRKRTAPAPEPAPPEPAPPEPAPPEPAPPEPAPPEPAPPVPEPAAPSPPTMERKAAVEYLHRLGQATLALRVDEDSYKRWLPLNLPPRLIGLLDGSRGVRRLLAESGTPEEELAALLQQLEKVDALEHITETPESEPTRAEFKPHVPEEPDRPPDEESTLEETGIPELLLGLRRRRVSGQLFVEGTDWKLCISLRNGAVTQAAGGPASTALGATLRRLGFLTDEEHSRLLAEHQRLSDEGQHLSLGRVAEQLDLIGPHHIVGALAEQIDSRLEALIALEQGSYRLYSGDPHSVSEDLEARSTEWLIARSFFGHGLRRLELVERFMRHVGDNGLQLTDEAEVLLPLFRFGPQAGDLADTVDGRTIPQIVAESPLPESETEAILYLLWAGGGIEMVPPREPPPASAVPAATPPGTEAHSPSSPPATPDPRRGLNPLLDEASAALARRDYTKALLALHVAKEKNPDNAEVLAALGWTVFRSQPGSDRVRAEARKLLEQALAIDAGAVSALVALAKIARIEGDLPTARIINEQILQLEGSNEEATREIKHIDRLEGRAQPHNEFDADATGGFLRLLFKRPESES